MPALKNTSPVRHRDEWQSPSARNFFATGKPSNRICPTDRYYNLPPEQRATQRLLDKFNGDERLWKKLEPRRRFRRKLLRRVLSERQIKQIDLLEFARERPPEDCIAQTLNQ